MGISANARKHATPVRQLHMKFYYPMHIVHKKYWHVECYNSYDCMIRWRLSCRYTASDQGWLEKSKRKEMKTVDMHYLVGWCCWYFGSVERLNCCSYHGFDVHLCIYIHSIEHNEKWKGFRFPCAWYHSELLSIDKYAIKHCWRLTGVPFSTTEYWQVYHSEPLSIDKMPFRATEYRQCLAIWIAIVVIFRLRRSIFHMLWRLCIRHRIALPCNCWLAEAVLQSICVSRLSQLTENVFCDGWRKSLWHTFVLMEGIYPNIVPMKSIKFLCPTGLQRGILQLDFCRSFSILRLRWDQRILLSQWACIYIGGIEW